MPKATIEGSMERLDGSLSYEIDLNSIRISPLEGETNRDVDQVNDFLSHLLNTTPLITPITTVSDFFKDQFQSNPHLYLYDKNADYINNTTFCVTLFIGISKSRT